MTVRAYEPQDVPAMRKIWNAVVADGMAFPQEEALNPDDAPQFFAAQTHCGVTETNGTVSGLYILHPNNIGRCGHIANASYAVAAAAHGCGHGAALVTDSLAQGRRLGFRILQFNAVVAENAPALHLYQKLGFVRLGTVPGGFRRPDGSYADIVLFYHAL